MKVTLTHPVEHDGKICRRASVRLAYDPFVYEASCPPGVDVAAHNLSVLIGWPIEAVAKLCDEDVRALGKEFNRQLELRRASLGEGVSCERL